MGFRRNINYGHPGFVSGRYYTNAVGTASTNFQTIENTLYFSPLYVPKATRFDRFAFTIATGAGHANNEVRTGIYESGANGYPGGLVVDNGRTVIGTGTGAINITISQQLAPGFYWLALIPNRAPGGSATQPVVRGPANEAARNDSIYTIGCTAPDLSAAGGAHYEIAETVADWTTYTLPNPATQPTPTFSAAYPLIWLRAA